MTTCKPTIHFAMVSLEENLFAGEAEMIVVTGVMGELGILPGHTPLLTIIKPGQIRIVLPGGGQDVYYISGGILEVRPEEATVLADMVSRAADLDEAAAIAARENAERMLQERRSHTDFTGALAQITQAAAKLRTIQLFHQHGK